MIFLNIFIVNKLIQLVNFDSSPRVSGLSKIISNRFVTEDLKLVTRT